MTAQTPKCLFGIFPLISTASDPLTAALTMSSEWTMAKLEEIPSQRYNSKRACLTKEEGMDGITYSGYTN